MAVIDEIRARSRAQTISGIEEKVAISLKESWSLIRLAAKKKGKDLPADPTSHISGATPQETDRLRAEEWLRLGKQIIDQRLITVGPQEAQAPGAAVTAGLSISVEELDESLTPDMKQALRITSFAQLVPRREQVNAIADTVSASVGRNSGTGIGFLDNLFGGASLGDVFMGLFNWVSSLFKGGFGGLKEAIANRTGERLKSGVVSDLNALETRLRSSDMSISAFMGPDVIRQVGAEVGRAPAASVRGGAPAAPGAAIAAARIGGFEDKMREKVSGMIQLEISSSIDTAFRANPQFTDLYREEARLLGMSWDDVKNVAGLSDKYNRLKALDAVRDRVSARVAALVTDKDYVFNGDDPNLQEVKGKKLQEMNTQTRAAVLAYEARQTIRQLAEESRGRNEGLDSFYSMLASSMPNALQDAIVQKDASIPWFLGGEINTAQLLGVTSPYLTMNPDELRQAAGELEGQLAQQMQQALYPGGHATREAQEIEALAGAPLKEVHFVAVSKALAPVMFEVISSPVREREMKEALAKNKPDGTPDDDARTATLNQLAQRFKQALDANAAAINVEGVNLSEQARELAAMRMAETFAKEKLGMTATPAGFTRLMTEKTEAIASAVLTTEIGGQLQQKKAELDALIDPTLRARPAPPAQPGLTDADMRGLNSAVVTALRPFALQPEFAANVATDALAYTTKHEDIAQKIFEELNKNTALPLSEQGKRALANEVAMAFLDKQGKVPDTVPVPGGAPGATQPNPLKEAVRRRVAASRTAAAEDLVRKTVILGLREPDTASMLRTANGGRDVNAEAVADAVKARLAERILDKDKLRAMTDVEYKNLVDQVRADLARNRDRLNIPTDNLVSANPSRGGEALLDILAVRITTQAVEAVAPDRRPPAAVLEKRQAAEAALMSTIVPARVREMLLPKLTGRRSVSDNAWDINGNLTIANLIAIDAARSGNRPNHDIILRNVSQVVLYHQIRASEAGGRATIDLAELTRQMKGALSDPEAGLGQSAIDGLGDILAREVKESIENPNRPARTPQQQQADTRAQAERMMTDFRTAVTVEVHDGLHRKAGDSLSRDNYEFISREAANAMAEIANGNWAKQGVPFVGLDDNSRRALVQDSQAHLLQAMEREYGWSFTNWKKDVADGVSAALTSTIAPENPNRQRLNRWGNDYAANGDPRWMAHRRAELHRETMAQIAAFRDVQTTLPRMLPEARGQALAVERFNDRFATPETPRPQGVTSDGYNAAVLEYLAEEQRGLTMPANANATDMRNVANAMRQKFSRILEMRNGVVASVEDQGRRAIEGATQREREATPRSNQVRPEDYLAGMPDTDPLKIELVALERQAAERTQQYQQQLRTLEDGLGKRAEEARRQLEAMQRSERPSEMHNRAQLEGVVESYRVQRARLDIEQGQARLEAASKKKALYARLPEISRATPEVQAAVTQRMTAAFANPSPQDIEARQQALRTSLTEMRTTLRGQDGQANLRRMLEARRRSMGLKPDGTPMNATEREAAAADLLLPVLFDARNPAGPVTPENIMDKARAAFPDAEAQARERGVPVVIVLEERIREMLPEWSQLKPQRVPAAANTDVERAYSERARGFLSAIDQMDLYTVTQDGQQVTVFLDDRQLPGFEAPTGRATTLPENLFMPNPRDPEGQKFETEEFTFSTGARSTFTIRQLTTQGKKDLMDVASGLQARLDDENLSDADRQKYTRFLQNIKDMARRQVSYYERGDSRNDGWKEVSGLLNGENSAQQLRDYRAGRLQLRLTREQEVLRDMTPDARAVRTAFDAEVAALRGKQGEELAGMLATRRAQTGLKPDGTPMNAAEITAAGAAVLPEAERGADRARSPITPENIMAKAAVAWPEKTPAQREEELRRLLPEVMKLRPKLKLDAAIVRADEGRSQKVKDLLKFLDEARIYAEGEGAARQRYLFDDLPAPGYRSSLSGEKVRLPELITVDMFETQSKRYDTNRNSQFEVQELTQQGKKDMVELAASLQMRIDSNAIPEADKEKYRDMLGDIQRLATRQRDYYSRRTEFGITAQDSWKEVSEIVGDAAKLRDFAAGRLSLQLTEEARQVAAMPTDRAALRTAFEADLRTLAAKKPEELAAEMTARRQKVGVKADGTAMSAAEITAAGAAVLPEADRRADSPRSPITPENMREKAALAWPEKSDIERELEIRRLFPEWRSVQPKSRLQATFDAMYTGNSDHVKTMLDFVDNARLYTVRQSNREVRQVIYDRSVYGLSGANGQPMNAELVVNNRSFSTESVRLKNNSNGRTYTFPDLSEAGMRDAMDVAVALQKRILTPGISQEEKDKYQFFLDDLRKQVSDNEREVSGLVVTGHSNAERNDKESNWAKLNRMMQPDTLVAMARPAEAVSRVMAAFDPLNPLASVSALTVTFSGNELRTPTDGSRPATPPNSPGTVR